MKNYKRTFLRKLLWTMAVFAVSVTVSMTISMTADAKAVKASLSAGKVAVGSHVQVKTSQKNVTFASSDSTVAYVNEDGVVTGKKAGQVSIQVKCSGYETKTLALTVKAVAKKPALPVALDEVCQQSIQMKAGKNGKYTYSAVVKNLAKKSSIRKVEYYYQITEKIVTTIKRPIATQEPETPAVESPVPEGQGDSADQDTGEQEETQWETVTSTETKKKTVVLKASSIKAGKKSKRVSCEGDYTGKTSGMKLLKVKLYTGDALYEYNAQKKTYSLKWGTKDTKAPVFSGWVGKKSAYNGVTIRVCYTDRKKSYQFKDHVTATDDRDGKVSFRVDTSKINWKKEGVYKVYYTAKDSAGNQRKAWAKVQVYIPKTAESIADEVLSSITKKSWSDEKKLRAIYRYVKGHCSYVDNGSHKNWKNAAVRGIRYQSGDCFTYYAIARLLITRAGIPNLMVTRYPAGEGYHHWWNLVYVRGGWYHLDTTPRQRDGKFCLVTDAQLRTYSTGRTFAFNKKLVPKRATKRISPNP